MIHGMPGKMANIRGKGKKPPPRAARAARKASKEPSMPMSGPMPMPMGGGRPTMAYQGGLAALGR